MQPVPTPPQPYVTKKVGVPDETNLPLVSFFIFLEFVRILSMNYLSVLLILVAVIFETVADVLFKKWSIESRNMILYAGLALYFIGTVIWAYSLKFNYLSKSITIFSVLNLIAVIAVGVIFFNEHLTLLHKIGIGLGIASVVLLNL